MRQPSNRPYVFAISMALILACLVSYRQLRYNDFVDWDDDGYITENLHVYSGITRENIIWAFGRNDISYWHPLTWLSHMLDCQLFGLNPAGHHLTNLIFHIANSLLLFLILKQTTGTLWQSAFVAALFALHPLNVDSVAWVAERKNVLSAFFWMLTTLAYIRYCRRPALAAYLLTVLPFALGLLAKPTLAVLPFVFVLLDFWPLGRFAFGRSSGTGKLVRSSLVRSRRTTNYELQTTNYKLRLLLEKIPLIILSLVPIYLSSLFLPSEARTISVRFVPMDLRIANALVCDVKYIVKMFWPQNLAVHYPYPDTVPMWQAVAAMLLLVSICVLVVRASKKKPYLTVGWFWFFGTLLPVSGLIQAGAWPAMADRFAYIPLIGLFIIIAWLLPELVAGWQHRKPLLTTAAVSVLIVLSICTQRQVRFWKDSFTLFGHALKVTRNNSVMHDHFGNALLRKNQLDDAAYHCRKALEIDPYSYKAHYNLGIVLQLQGKTDEAIRHYRQALRIKPDYTDVHNNLAVALKSQGRLDEAIGHYRQALQEQPNDASVHYNLGDALIAQGKSDEAISHYRQALQYEPNHSGAHNNLGLALQSQGKVDEAITHYNLALQINPNFVRAHYNLGNALKSQGRLDEAVNHYRQALQLRPNFAEAHCNLANTLRLLGRLDEAINHYREALRIKPDFTEAKNNLAAVLGRNDNPPQNIRSPDEPLPESSPD